MTFRRESRLRAFTALALILLIGAAIVQESAVHTDDGCAVEVHCVACRWACSAVTTGVQPPVVAVAPAPPEPLPPPGSEADVAPTHDDAPCLRGPPLPA